MFSPTWNRRRSWWAAIGALVLIVANVVWARAAGGSEWADPAIVMSPIAAMIGAAAGYGVAVLAERRAR